MNAVGLDPDNKEKSWHIFTRNEAKTQHRSGNNGKPELYLLDEPTNALDEGTVNDIRDLLLSLKKKMVH